MILQALHSYYQRLADQEDSRVAPEGFAPQPISFAFQLSDAGELLDITDLRATAPKGKKLVPRSMIVPDLGEAKGSGIKATFLWGTPDYVLGRSDKSDQSRTAKCREAFRLLHEKLLKNIDALEVKALLSFLQNPPQDHPRIEEQWKDLASSNVVFRVGGQFLHEITEARASWVNQGQDENSEADGVCLVTGERTTIAKLHPFIKGLNATGAALSSYNQDSFLSFGKEKNFNAPIGKPAAFGYTTALNYLIKKPNQSLRLGEANVVCWAVKATPLEENLFALLGASPSQEEEADIESASERAGVLRRLGQGFAVTEAWPGLEPDTQMHVLALALNKSRLSVGFYLHGPAGEFLEHIRQYYTHLAIIHRFEDEPEFPSVWQIARAVLGPNKKAEDIKRLGEDILRAALSSQAYPAYLLPMCLQRLRSGDDHNSVRAGLIRAMLIRNYQLNPQKEASMSLNPDHPSPAYQLGRLFALLVGVQRKAIGPQINADIRDKYYGSASATPALVFPLLLRNAQNHISKAQGHGYDKLIRDVLEHINDEFPSHFDLKDQGLFALGYYHQRAEKAVKQDEDNNHANPDQA